MKRLLTILLVFVGVSVSAQDWALKTNLFYDATTTMNLGFETRVAPKWTLDVSANWNPWTFSENKKWKQLSLQPEARYWFCEAFNGHFVGAHLLGGIYNMGNWDTDSLRRLDVGSRRGLRLSMAALETLERGGRNRNRLCLLASR